MNAFTPTELAQLRSQPQNYQPRLAVYKPAILWTGIVNNSPAKGDRTISVATVSGSLSNVLAGMTMIVDPGINEERFRIKLVAGSNITVDENSMDWSYGTRLNILLLFDVFAVKPRIVNNNNVITYYEDYDVAYVDQNSIYSPVVNIGPAAYALELECEASGTHTDLTIDSSDSFVFDSTIASYQWGILYGDNAPYDAEIVGSSTIATATFRFWQTGDYYIYCTMTATNGKVSTGYRSVMVRCSEPGHADSPFYNFTISSLAGSRDTGYWSSKIAIFEKCDQDKLPRSVPVVIYGNVVYGKGATRSTSNIPWHYDTTAHQRFVGWIVTEQWTKEYTDQSAVVSFDAVGICGLLDQMANYSVWLHYNATPTDWTMMKSLSIDRMLYFILHNRTTVLNITDWHKVGTTKLTQYAGVAEGKIYSGLRDFLRGTEYADLISDRCSALWSEYDGRYLTDAQRASIVTDVMTVTSQDRMNNVIIPVTRDKKETSWLSIDGLYFDGSNNVPRISYAPGYVLNSEGGSMDNTSGLIIGAQTDLNTLAGRLFSVKNNPFKSIEMSTMGVYPYDIAPQASLHYNDMVSGTFREETIEDADLLFTSIDDKFVPASMGLISDSKLEMLVRDSNAVVGPGIPTAVAGVEGLFPPPITGLNPDQFNTDWGNFGNLFDWPIYDSTIPDTTGAGTPFADSPAIYTWSKSSIGRLRKGSVHWEKVLDVSTFVGYAVGTIFICFNLDPWDPKNHAYILIRNVHAPTFNLFEVTNLDGAVGTQIVTQFTIPGLNDMGDTTVGNGFYVEPASININGFLMYGAHENTTWGGDVVLRRISLSASVQQKVVQSASPGVYFGHPITTAIGHHAANSSNGRAYARIFYALVPRHYDIYKSDDYGATWSLDHSYSVPADVNIAAPMCIPFQDNPNDAIMYTALWSDASSLTRRNADGSYSYIGIPNGSGGYRYITCIYICTTSRLKMAVIADGLLYTSTDGGNTFTLRNLPDTFSGNTIWGYPSDENVLFIQTNTTISYSSDLFTAGPTSITWNDITFDYFPVIDSPANSQGQVAFWT